MTKNSNVRQSHIDAEQLAETRASHIDHARDIVNSEYIERFKFYQHMKRLYGDTLPSAEQLTDLAGKLYREYLQGIDGTRSIFFYILFLEVIKKVEEHINVGKESEIRTHTTEMLEEALVARLALGIFKDFTKKDDAEITELAEQYKDTVAHDFFRFTYEMLKKRMLDFRNAYRFADIVNEQVARVMPDANLNEREMRRMNDELFSELKRLQRYTPKQVEFDDPLVQVPKLMWYMVSCQYLRKEIPKLQTISNEASMTMRTDGMVTFTFALMFERDTDKFQEASRFFEGRWYERKYDSSNPPSEAGMMLGGLEFTLDKETGELFLKRYPLRIPLKAFFERFQAGGAYEQLRCVLLSALFDNIVPRTIADRVQTMQTLQEKLRTSQSKSPTALAGIVRDFIAPRIAYVKQMSDEQIEQELKDEFMSSNGRHVPHQFFGRVGHPMRVRAGYRPHPDSRKWAKEDGFHRELEENETWCRPVESPVPVVHRQKGRKE